MLNFLPKIRRFAPSLPSGQLASKLHKAALTPPGALAIAIAQLGVVQHVRSI